MHKNTDLIAHQVNVTSQIHIFILVKMSYKIGFFIRDND